MNAFEKLSKGYQYFVAREKRLRKEGDTLGARLADATATQIAIEMMTLDVSCCTGKPISRPDNNAPRGASEMRNRVA